MTNEHATSTNDDQASAAPLSASGENEGNQQDGGKIELSAIGLPDVKLPAVQMPDVQMPDVQLPSKEEVLSELEVDKESFSREMPMTMGYKVLIVCISFVLFVLVEVLVLSVLANKDSWQTVLEEQFPTILSAIFCALSVIAIICLLLILYLITLFFSKKHEDARYCVFVRQRGLLVYGFFFFLIAAFVAWAMTCFTDYDVTILIATFIAAIIAFFPVMITWNVYEEERLKNFIDGFSKTCSCMAFMGGAIALLVNTFLI